jgi:hypothetical protein
VTEKWGAGIWTVVFADFPSFFGLGKCESQSLSYLYHGAELVPGNFAAKFHPFRGADEAKNMSSKQTTELYPSLSRPADFAALKIHSLPS